MMPRSIDKKLVIVLIASVSIHILFSALWLFMGHPQYSLGGDAPSYINTAHNVLEKGIWSSDSGAYPRPDNFRTPVYPLMLALFIGAHISLLFVALFQDLLLVCGAVITYTLGKKLFSPRVAFISALCVGLSPYLASSFVARSIMTEPLALTLTTAAFLSLAIFIDTKRARWLYIGTLLLGIDALTKPQFVLFGVTIILAVALATTRMSTVRSAAKQCITACVLFAALLAPWAYYTFVTLGVTQFSSVSHTTLFDAATRFKSWESARQGVIYDQDYRRQGRIALGIPLNDTAFSDHELFEPHNAARLAQVGMSIIVSSPLDFALYHIIHIPRLFYHDTTIDSLHEDFGIFPSIEGGDDIDIIKYAATGHIRHAYDLVMQHPAWTLSLMLKLATLLMSILAFASYYFDRRKSTLFLISVLALYGILVSPFGLHRYRVPIEPILLLLGLTSISLFARNKKRLALLR